MESLFKEDVDPEIVALFTKSVDDVCHRALLSSKLTTEQKWEIVEKMIESGARVDWLQWMPKKE